MISTVTTSTVTTVAIAGSVATIGILVLLALLVQKELASTSKDSRFKNMTRILNIGIVPLLIAFCIIIVTRVIEILK